MQGWRLSMEDSHCAITQLPGNLKDWSFFAVFDGHAGALVSELCATELLKVCRLFAYFVTLYCCPDSNSA